MPDQPNEFKKIFTRRVQKKKFISLQETPTYLSPTPPLIDNTKQAKTV